MTVTADQVLASEAEGLVVPGVGAFAACMAGLKAIGADEVLDYRMTVLRPTLGICVGMQVLFQAGVEHGVETEGLGVLPGRVEELRAPIRPHMGWNTVDVCAGDAAEQRSRLDAPRVGGHARDVHRCVSLQRAHHDPVEQPGQLSQPG